MYARTSTTVYNWNWTNVVLGSLTRSSSRIKRSRIGFNLHFEKIDHDDSYRIIILIWGITRLIYTKVKKDIDDGQRLYWII